MEIKLKVLFLSTSDILGGASRATYLLGKGLREENHEVSMCVQHKSGDFSWVWQVNQTKIQKFNSLIKARLESIPLRFYKPLKHRSWSLNIFKNTQLISKIIKEKPDIINLHWVGGGFIPISQLKLLNIPIVWSLYDMWPFTGGCHYDEGCGKFVDKCGKCPQLNSNHLDISSYVMNMKKKNWEKLPITIVSPSKWLASEARKSSLFSKKRIEVIPHGTDLKLFKPIDKLLAKDILGLDKNQRHVLFGATGGTQDSRKGFQYLEPALKHLANQPGFNNICLLVFGSSEPAVPPELGFPIRYVGRLHDDASLAVLYSAADVTVTPSLQEAFGMTASESMACGTPVVAFKASGPLDVVDHMVNGYLASLNDIEDLARGISWVLDQSRATSLSIAARAKCMKNFDLGKVAREYSNLYSELILS